MGKYSVLNLSNRLYTANLVCAVKISSSKIFKLAALSSFITLPDWPAPSEVQQASGEALPLLIALPYKLPQQNHWPQPDQLLLTPAQDAIPLSCSVSILLHPIPRVRHDLYSLPGQALYAPGSKNMSTGLTLISLAFCSGSP